MVEIGEEDLEHADQIAANADVHRDAWQGTIEDMQALGEELEAEGWDVCTVASGQTATEDPAAGETDRWGLTHVIPDNFAEEFDEYFEEGGYPEYDVFRQEVEGRLFLVTLLEDPDAQSAILIAGQFQLFEAGPLVATAKEEGEVYTHVTTLDGTLHGSFRHDQPSKFFPNYEDYAEHFDATTGESA